MIRLLVFCLLLVPAMAQAQQYKLVAECSDLKGYTYLFPNTLQTEEGWDTDGMTGVKMGLFENRRAEPADRYEIKYHTASQGWQYPRAYLTTVRLNGSVDEGSVTATILYSDNAAEVFMFMLEKGKVAVSFMRHSGILENARLFVGDCERRW